MVDGLFSLMSYHILLSNISSPGRSDRQYIYIIEDVLQVHIEAIINSDSARIALRVSVHFQEHVFQIFY